MKLKLAEEKDRAIWNKIVSENPEGWTSHFWEWQFPMKEIGWNCENVFAYSDNGRCMGVLPLYYKSKKILLKKVKYYSSSANSFGGMVFVRTINDNQKPNILTELNKELKTFIKKQRGIFCDIKIHPKFNKEYAIKGLGYKKYTFIVDLSLAEADLMANLKKNARTAIKKAEKSGVLVKKVESLEELRKFYDLHVATYERTGAQTRPFSYFESFYTHLALNGLCTFYIAVFEGRVIGGILVIGNKNVAVYGAGASNAEFAQYNPNNFLLWHALLDAKAAGFKYFDLSSVAHPNRTQKEEGIFRFKESFGGEFTEKDVVRVFCSKIQEKLHKWLKKE